MKISAIDGEKLLKCIKYLPKMKLVNLNLNDDDLNLTKWLKEIHLNEYLDLFR